MQALSTRNGGYFGKEVDTEKSYVNIYNILSKFGAPLRTTLNLCIITYLHSNPINASQTVRLPHHHYPQLLIPLPRPLLLSCALSLSLSLTDIG